MDITIPATAVKAPVTGQLVLNFAYHTERRQTYMDVCVQQQPLQVIRAFPQAHGATLVHLHNLSGGVLGGDRLDLSVHVGPRAAVQLTSTSATRLYRSSPTTTPALQTTSLHVDTGGLLEYLPDSLIPFADAAYQQRTRVELAEDAGLFWWEIIAPGRLARGESFAYRLLHLQSTIMAQSRPIAIERLQLEPSRRSFASLARLGSYRFFSTFYICRVGVDAARWLQLEQQLSELAREMTRLDEVLWGVSTLVAHGLVVRCLSREGRHIAPGLFAFWQTAKRELYEQEAVLPRKVY